jgi:DNA-binding NarL/FixJ family response regulator
MPDRKAAREMGVTTRTIERYRQVLGIYSAGRAEFPRRLEEFRRMHAEGVPVLQIAARLHVARRTVWGYRARGRREGWL